MPLDTLVTGRVATFAGASGFGWVEAVGIRDGRIAFAGSAVDLESRADPHTRRIELEPGELAMPGIIDAHLHLTGAALAAQEIDLTPAQTIDDALALVAAAARRLAAPGWILGGGWDQRRFGAWPTAAALERAAPGRLVALRAFDHHALWASSAALAAAGVDRSTPDPAGGVIRREAGGSPDGVLLENAGGVVLDLVPPPDDPRVRGAIASYGLELLRLGIVGVHDPARLTNDPDNHALDLYAAMAEDDELPLRVRACVRADGLDNAVARGLRSNASLGAADRSMLSFGWLKLFADGTLGSGTAALLDPVEGGSDRGLFLSPPEQLAELAAKAADAGIATMIHAIGDAACRAALDALAPTVAKVPLMPRLEHVQLLDATDRPRFRQLGVAASVQPVHLREDAATARRDWGSRAETNGYAWRSLVDAGATLAFGTDAPVEPADPWPGIAIAVLRRDPSWGNGVEPYGPDEALSLEQALRAATVGPASTAKDRLGGRLIPGSPADLIVLPAAPRESQDASERAAAFAQVRPRLVMLGGEVVVER
ncbi:MAG TPA: amidohydrolase [Candidatus Limnocylindrales bacterium]|nr:amidohydrolase [Candidatus Limnocylindrales bacterium]